MTAVTSSVQMRTARGEIRARTLVLCGNAYLDGVVPALENRIMPVSTQIMATEPLGDLARTLMPADTCVEDVRYILDYFRMSADGRLLFGGGTVYGGADPSDIKAKLWKNMLKVFPQLAATRIDYAWSGNFALSFSRVPQMGRIGAKVKENRCGAENGAGVSSGPRYPSRSSPGRRSAG